MARIDESSKSVPDNFRGIDRIPPATRLVFPRAPEAPCGGVSFSPCLPGAAATTGPQAAPKNHPPTSPSPSPGLSFPSSLAPRFDCALRLHGLFTHPSRVRNEGLGGLLPSLVKSSASGAIEHSSLSRSRSLFPAFPSPLRLGFVLRAAAHSV